MAKIAKQKGKPYCVGFAAESDRLGLNTKEKRVHKGIPMIVGNIGPSTFGSEMNSVLIVDASTSKSIGPASKLEIARQLIALVSKRL
jgi:phosphopantothenoylcysteine decarboxylase/phosphopantothenate--cysteine ligase